MPRADGLPARNAYFRARGAGAVGGSVAGYGESVGQRCARDRAEALALPPRPFDACAVQAAQVDKYQTVRCDHNRYGVPRACAYRAVTVKGYSDRVAVVDGGPVVARHGRSYGRDGPVLEPLPYRAALGRRPAALDHAPVLRDGQLPASFARLRQALEGRHGPTAGRRPGPGTTAASCSCRPSTRWGACRRPSRAAGVGTRCTPRVSAPGRGGWRGLTAPGRPPK